MRSVWLLTAAIFLGGCSGSDTMGPLGDPGGAGVSTGTGTPTKCATSADCPADPCLNVSCSAGFCDSTNKTDGLDCSMPGKPGKCEAGSCSTEGACSTHADCDSDLRCYAGSCGPALADGGDCSKDAALCATESYCGKIDTKCVPGTCCAKAKLGEICLWSGGIQKPCVEGTVCDTTAGSPTIGYCIK